MSEPPFVSVIVPVYNDASRLTRCLEALEAQIYPSERYEIIVVDNASDVPAAPLVARHAHARGVLERAPGAYAARNAGLVLARGEIIAFTDSDCLPAPDWLAQGVVALGDDVDVAGGWIQTAARDPARPTLVERYALFSSREQPEVLARGDAATGNLFARRAVFDVVGPFDPSCRSGSDYEWCRRARAKGKPFVGAPNARVGHPARDTLAEIVYRYQRFTGGQYVRARRRGRGAVFGLGVAILRASLRALPSILRDNSVAPRLSIRLGVVLVACAVSGGRLAELIRLTLGLTEPKR